MWGFNTDIPTLTVIDVRSIYLDLKKMFYASFYSGSINGCIYYSTLCFIMDISCGDVLT